MSYNKGEEMMVREGEVGKWGRYSLLISMHRIDRGDELVS